MKPQHIALIIVAVAVLLCACTCFICSLTYLFAFAASQSDTLGNSPVLVGTSGAPNKVTDSQVFKVGDVIQLDDRSVTLQEARFTTEKLVLTFLVENTGKDPLSVGMSADARNQDGSALSGDWLGCGQDMSGTIPPGEKAKGEICFKGPFSPPVKIYYKPDWLNDTMITWSVSP